MVTALPLGPGGEKLEEEGSWDESQLRLWWKAVAGGRLWGGFDGSRSSRCIQLSVSVGEPQTLNCEVSW